MNQVSPPQSTQIAVGRSLAGRLWRMLTGGIRKAMGLLLLPLRIAKWGAILAVLASLLLPQTGVLHDASWAMLNHAAVAAVRNCITLAEDLRDAPLLGDSLTPFIQGVEQFLMTIVEPQESEVIHRYIIYRR